MIEDAQYWQERHDAEQRFAEKEEMFAEARGMALAILNEEIDRRSEGVQGTGYARQALKTARSRIEREVTLG